jgi:hypothetical protein
MEIVRKGSEDVYVIVPMNCCYPSGTFGIRTR